LTEGLISPLKRILAGSDSAEKKAILSAAGYFNEIALGNLAARFSPDDGLPGILSKATNTFFKWNLLSGWTDGMRRSTVESMAHYWGSIAEKTFAQLSERNKMALTRFRIGEKEWAVVSKGIAEADGRKFLTPAAVRELDPELFRSLAADRLKQGDSPSKVNRILDDTRTSVADRLQQFYADDLDSAVIQPDARTLSLMRQGTQAGTPIGEALRLFWQFKSFGIAVMQRAFLRELHGYGPKSGISQVSGIGLLMLGSLGFGYMAMSMKDLLRGKEPKPIDNPKTWASAMAQGGGLGIYGDFLMGQQSRMGGGFLSTLGGPTVGKLDSAAQLWGAIKRGDDVSAQALRFAVSNTPYNNLFYTRMAADYLALYEIQESMNPGYLRRMERKTEEDTGQQWWLRPSEVVR
jgi:hypothetical protein